MAATYLLDPSVEVIPTGPDRFELRSPLWGTKIDANAYQVGILQQFDDESSVESVLANLPFHREETAAFLERCIERQILLVPRADGVPQFPDRSQPYLTFASVPAYDASQPAAFTLLGIPFDANTTGNAGAKFGPTAIRAASEGARYRVDPQSFEPLGFHDYSSGQTLLAGITMADAGDVVISPGEPLDATYDRISRVVREIVEAGTIPLIMGGDHSVTYPILRALPHERIGLIHFDAHTDLGDAMPGALLHHGNVFSVVLERLEFVEHITQVGLRSILDLSDHTPTECVTQVGIDAFRARGVDDIVAGLVTDVPYYMTIDIDVLDPAFAPSTGTPVANGMFPHELKALVRAAAQRVDIIGCDIVEVAAPLGPADSTAGMAYELLFNVADATVRGLQARLASADTDSAEVA